MNRQYMSHSIAVEQVCPNSAVGSESDFYRPQQLGQKSEEMLSKRLICLRQIQVWQLSVTDKSKNTLSTTWLAAKTP